MPIFRLDFKALFRAHAQRDREDYANAVGRVTVLRNEKTGKIRREASGLGGSLATTLRKLPIKVKSWGYVIPYASVGQKLLWFLRGAKRPKSTQPARPVDYDDEARAQELADAIDEQATALVSRYDEAA